MVDAPPSAAGAWSHPRKILFRFAAIYAVLYMLPFPVLSIWSTGERVLTWAKTIGQPEPAAAEAPRRNFAELDYEPPPFEAQWERITSAVGEQLDVEVVHDFTGSGDTTHDLLKVLVIAAFALLAAAIWSGLDRRRPDYRRLARWLHLWVRWYLGFQMIGYGTAKLFAGQFVYPNLYRMTTELGDMTPMGLVWTFMGYSKPYEVFTGLGETIGGLLLLWRRTSLLGALIIVAVMSNVAMLNWFYDVPVKLFSTHLLVMALALTLPDLGRLWRMFFGNRTVEPQDLRLSPSRGVTATMVVFASIWLATHLTWTVVDGLAAIERRRVERSPLYGVWDVRDFTKDGERVPPTSADPDRFERILFDRPGTAMLVFHWGQRVPLEFDVNMETEVARVRAAANRPAGDEPEFETWQLSFETVTEQEVDPNHRYRAGQPRRMMDVERRRMRIRGSWRGADLDVLLQNHAFRLERGFHMVQEQPFNR